MPATIEPPVVQAMVLADEVHVDPSSGKQTVIGLFTTVTARTFPANIARESHVFLVLTNLRRPAAFELHWRVLHDNSLLRLYVINPEQPPAPTPTTFIVKTGSPITSASPLDAVSVSLKLGVLPFPRPGRYAMDLVYEGGVIGTARIRADSRPR
jgi:hypothetical protein